MKLPMGRAGRRLPWSGGGRAGL